MYLDLAKNEKRQNCLGFDVQGSFTIPPSAQKRCHFPLLKGGTNRFVLFYMAWFSLFYRQSKTPAFDRGEKIIRFHLRTVLLLCSTRSSRRLAPEGRIARQGNRCPEMPCTGLALSRYILAQVCKNRMRRRSFEHHAPFGLSKTDRALPKPPCRDVAALTVE